MIIKQQIKCKEKIHMFQIISDGSCDLSAKQLQDAEIEVVPFYVSLDGEKYQKEMVELDVHTFYEFCVSHPNVFPKTSMPTIQDYMDVFENHLQRGVDILCYCLTEKFSGSFSCATTAAAMLMDDYPDRIIRVVDSTLATGLQGLLLLELAKYKKEGHSLDETYERGEEIKRTASIYFTIENLSYLSHGGRIGKLADMALRGMSIRPIIRFGSGELHPVGAALGGKNTYDRVVQTVRKLLREQRIDMEHYTFAMGWGYNREEAEPFFQQIRELFLERFGQTPDFIPIQIGATIGVHTGPHPVGIGFIEKA